MVDIGRGNIHVESRVGLGQPALYEGACVGEPVEVDYERTVACGNPIEDEVAADESGAAGYENRHSG